MSYSEEKERYIETVRKMRETETKTGIPARFHPAEKLFSPKRMERYKSEIQPSLTRKVFHVK